MLDFTRKLTLESATVYVAWLMRNRQRSINLRLRSGPRFELRGSNEKNNDYGVAYEVFVHNYYGGVQLPANDVRLIVDLGANVGCSVLYFLYQYPRSHIIAVEPHKGHFAQLDHNLRLNHNRERVELYAKAAGARTRSTRLTDDKASSTLTDSYSPKTLPVEVLDIFPILSRNHIDLLKMDIEGGEYEILEDERFATLNIDAIVMEWHSRGRGVEDKQWCEQRLINLGFEIREIFTLPSHGMFWAIHR